MTDSKPSPCRINLRLRPGADDDLLWFLGHDLGEIGHTKRCWGRYARNFKLYRLAETYLKNGFSGIETGDPCVADRSSGHKDVAFRISNTTPTLYRYGMSFPPGLERASAIRFLFDLVCRDFRNGQLKVSGLPGAQAQPTGGRSDNQEQQVGEAQCTSDATETPKGDEEPDYGPLGRATPEAIDMLMGWGTDDWIEPPDDWVEPSDDWVESSGDWVESSGDWVESSGDY